MIKHRIAGDQSNRLLSIACSVKSPLRISIRAFF